MIKYTLNIVVFSAILCLSLYHFLLYIRNRRAREERYHFYFTLFSFSIAAYVFINSLHVLGSTHLIDHIPGFLTYLVNRFLRSPFYNSAQAVCFFGITVGTIQYLSLLLHIPSRRIFSVSYGLSAITVVLTLSGFVFSLFWYIQYLLFPATILVMLNFLLLFGIFSFWIVKNELYRKKGTRILLCGFVILISFLVLEVVCRNIYLSSFYRNYHKYFYWITNGYENADYRTFLQLYALSYSAGNISSYFNYNTFLSSNFFYYNFIFAGLSVFLFAYDLAVKYDRERITATERTKELDEANRIIKDLLKSKTEFFIKLAHETKNPLTLIQNFLNRYIRESGKNKNIEAIKQNVDKLLCDVLGFMDVERIEKGELAFDHTVAVDFSAILRDKLKLFQPLADKHQVTLVPHIDTDIVLHADPLSLDAVINNLIMNAMKFSKENGVIAVHLSMEDTGIRFSVTDNGSGISPVGKEHIFTPAYKCVPGNAAKQGMGVGLYIVKHIVDSLRGTITVESVPDVATCFTVRIPCNGADDASPAQGYAVSEPFDIKPTGRQARNSDYVPGRYTVLLIEDDVHIRTFLGDTLTERYNVFPARNGKDALVNLSVYPKPDIIISDIMMDEMDGYQFLDFIKKDPRYNFIPMIFLTAKTNFREKIKGISTGAIDYIYKPFSIEEVTAKVHSILTHEMARRRADFHEAGSLVIDAIDGKKDPKDNRWERFERKCREYMLTERQKEIVVQIDRGLENKEIAGLLNISIKTVNRHIQDLFEKCNVHNRIELINVLFN